MFFDGQEFRLFLNYATWSVAQKKKRKNGSSNCIRIPQLNFAMISNIYFVLKTEKTVACRKRKSCMALRNIKNVGDSHLFYACWSTLICFLYHFHKLYLDFIFMQKWTAIVSALITTVFCFHNVLSISIYFRKTISIFATVSWFGICFIELDLKIENY